MTEPVFYRPPEAETSNAFRKMVIGLVVFFAALIVIAILVVANSGFIARQIPFAAEKRFSEPYADLIRDSFGVEGNEAGQVYLAELVDVLALAMEIDPEIEITTHFIDTPLSNAAASIGGHIFIYRGLVEQMPDENSLAMVLAHEIGHIEHRDPIAAMGRGLTVVFILGFISGDVSGVGAEIGMNIGLNVYSRKQEAAADEAALYALDAHYGHVAGYDTFFKLALSEQADQDLPEWLSTHPDLDKRIEALTQIKNENGMTSGEVTPLPDVF